MNSEQRVNTNPIQADQSKTQSLATSSFYSYVGEDPGIGYGSGLESQGRGDRTRPSSSRQDYSRIEIPPPPSTTSAPRETSSLPRIQTRHPLQGFTSKNQNRYEAEAAAFSAPFYETESEANSQVNRSQRSYTTKHCTN